jgi:hypothetical protein
MSKSTTVSIRKPLSYPASKEILEKLRKWRLNPAINLYSVCAGGSFDYIDISWRTLLIDGSLKVLLNGNTDITSHFTIDNTAMKATATVDTRSVGTQQIEATGEFLAQLVPVRIVSLSAITYVYNPY